MNYNIAGFAASGKTRSLLVYSLHVYGVKPEVINRLMYAHGTGEFYKVLNDLKNEDIFIEPEQTTQSKP